MYGCRFNIHTHTNQYNKTVSEKVGRVIQNAKIKAE